MSREDYIIFGKPFIGEEEIAEVVASLRAGWPGTGPKVNRFEEAFRSYIGAEHAVALHSCTAALFLGQVALGIGPGDAVVTTPLTFVATASSVRHAGATPLFADVEESSGLLDPTEVERLLVEDCVQGADGHVIHRATGARVKALLPVHLWGQPADMIAFRRLADRFDLLLIEDAAHAIEATVGEQKVGTTADVSCFSFYTTKNLCTGEGGMITTASTEVANRVRTLAAHGLTHDAWQRFSDPGYRHYLATESGWKLTMMDLQAALGLHQLQRLPAFAEQRARQWRAYRQELAGLPGISLPALEATHGRHARHLFTVRIGAGAIMDRDSFLSALHDAGVGCGVHYLAVTEHPAFHEHLGVPVPHAQRIGRETLSIPLGGALSDEQRSIVSAKLRAIANGG